MLSLQNQINENTVMKKRILPLTAFFIFAIVFPFQQLAAQDKTTADQEKEQKIQREIDQQKKAINDQKKAKAEAEQLNTDQDKDKKIMQITDLQSKSGDDQAKAMAEAADSMRDQASDIEKNLKNIQVEIESAGDDMNGLKVFTRRGHRDFDFDRPFAISSAGENFFMNNEGGDSERTTWEFSKFVKDNTFSRDYNFDVEKTVNSVVMSVMGDCKKGEININIVMPNGKNYSDIVIDEFGNLNWRKSFTISETENQDKAGEWKFKIASKGATGYFKISLHTY
jgi:hypothetical protein